MPIIFQMNKLQAVKYYENNKSRQAATNVNQAVKDMRHLYQKNPTIIEREEI